MMEMVFIEGEVVGDWIWKHSKGIQRNHRDYRKNITSFNWIIKCTKDSALYRQQLRSKQK